MKPKHCGLSEHVITGEMAVPQYTGRVADWIKNEQSPDAFTEAITVMTLLTVAR